MMIRWGPRGGGGRSGQLTRTELERTLKRIFSGMMDHLLDRVHPSSTMLRRRLLPMIKRAYNFVADILESLLAHQVGTPGPDFPREGKGKSSPGPEFREGGRGRDAPRPRIVAGAPPPPLK